jgi:RNA polymerase sigma-70 factor, ECF subfamily
MHDRRTVDAPPATGLLDDRWAETLGRLQAFVAARVGDDDKAADITQDASRAASPPVRSNGRTTPIAWLYRSAHNAVIDHYRTRRRHEPIDGRLDREVDPASRAADDRPNSATRELARCLQPLVGALAPIYREAVTRVDLDGQTHQQAAAELGLSVSGMKSRVQRGRRQLQDLLSACCAVHLDRTGAVAGYQPHGGACGCSTPA